MSHLHFRPRPIDINAPLPIITDEALIKDFEAETINVGKATGRWNNVRIETQNREYTQGDEVVFTPSFRVINNDDSSPSLRFHRPSHYISYELPPPEEETGEIEYELDKDDEIFLDTLNNYVLKNDPNFSVQNNTKRTTRSEGSTPRKTNLFRQVLTDFELEQIISYLEMETFFKRGDIYNIVHYHHQYDPPCVICNDGEFDEIGNSIIFCDGCNIAVHQNCYGVQSISEGTFLCRKCEFMTLTPTPPSPSFNNNNNNNNNYYNKASPPMNPSTPSTRTSSITLRSSSNGIIQENSLDRDSGKSIRTSGSFLFGEPVPVTTPAKHGISCAICPVKDGAFKRSIDGRKWVHVVCVLWTPELSFTCPKTLEPIEGLADIPPHRWGKKCVLCKGDKGVCLTCEEKGCQTTFHPSCGRNKGLAMLVKPKSKAGPSSTSTHESTRSTTHNEGKESEGEFSFVAYCPLHSLYHLEHYPPVGHSKVPSIISYALNITEVPLSVLGLVYSYWRTKRKAHPAPLIKRLEILQQEGYKVYQHADLRLTEYQMRFVKLRRDFERARLLIDLIRKRELLKKDYIRKLGDILDFLNTETSGSEKMGEEGETEKVAASPNKKKKEDHHHHHHSSSSSSHSTSSHNVSSSHTTNTTNTITSTSTSTSSHSNSNTLPAQQQSHSYIGSNPNSPSHFHFNYLRDSPSPHVKVK